MSITNITPRETELQKQVIDLAESLRNLGWEFELYKTGARATHQKLLDEIRELKAKLAESAEIIEQRNAMLSRGHADFMQALTDPENQPSQFGTVTLEMYQELKAKLAEAEKRLHMLLMPVPAKDVTALDVCKVVSERAMEIIQLLKETP